MILNGLLNNKVEIFRDEQFKVYATAGGKVIPFSEFPAELLRALRNEYNADVLSRRVIALEFTDNEAAFERWTACRYGAMDSVADFDKKTGKLKPDFGLCPRRHKCLGFCITCQSPSTETGARLTPREIDVLQEMLTGKPDKQSHSILGIAADTYNELKRRLFTKLGAHSKVEAMSKARKIMDL